VIVDAHFHVWRLARGDYGWLSPALGAIHRDISVSDWWRVAAPCGVQRGVLVQAAPTEAETQFLLATADTDERVAGVVGWADLLAPGAPDRIAALARHPKLKGLRPMLHDLDDVDWVLLPTLAPAFEAMIEHGLVFDALVRPLHLPRIRELGRRHPRLVIVLDHAGKPAIATSGWNAWAAELERVGAETSALCKLSGLLTEATPAQATTAALQPWVHQVLESFGPERVLWGSDWPVLELAGHFADWWQLSVELARGLTDAQRRAVFGGNAARSYRL
jgi:L-fuconolactonase